MEIIFQRMRQVRVKVLDGELQLQHEGDDDAGLGNETVVQHKGCDKGDDPDLEGAECIVDYPHLGVSNVENDDRIPSRCKILD